MKPDLQSFHDDFFQQVLREADAEKRFSEDSFFDLFCEQIVEAGDLETADRAQYIAPRGIRIDGYGGDPALAEGTLTLIIADFNQNPTIATLTASDMDASFRRATAFLEGALQRSFRDRLEESSPGFGLADMIASSWSEVVKVRFLLISNRVLSSRVDGRPAGELDGRPVTYSVWDLGRLERFASSGKSREDIVVEMRDYGGAVHALQAALPDAAYEAYLLVLRGDQLASIYDRWGARLLEQNVRVFLQARGGVNKGIRNTLDNEPQMFFAFNNGITATAEEVQGSRTGGGITISAIRNLQIVNGGQTTASIYAAQQRKDVDLRRVHVQMKLAVIQPDAAAQVLPRISQYANTQNKVNAADFFANHPFHLRFKSFSDVVFAPSQDGTFRDSKWFYERARGQYQDARAGLTLAKRRRFDMEYPRSQMLTKTDLAKMLLVWQEVPHIVSRGAQKAFAYFAERISSEWDARPDQFNEQFFRESIAKAIVFRATEALVSEQPWYNGGYRANIVAYAIGRVANLIRTAGMSVDFDAIWRNQALMPALADTLLSVASAANDVLLDTPPGIKNVTEWAKKEGCWTRMQQVPIPLASALKQTLLTKEEAGDTRRSAVREQRMLNGIEAQAAVVSAGAELWGEVRSWAIEHRLLSQKELEILSVAASMPKKLPTEKQCLNVLASLKRLREEGCPLGADVLVSSVV